MIMKQARPIKMGKKQYLGDGGKAQGLAHEEGGIKAQKDGKSVAEIELNERVFSQEDTEFMDAEAQKISAYMESGDQVGADKCAKDLGYAVAKMVIKQDMNEAASEDDQIAASNDFSNGGYDE